VVASILVGRMGHAEVSSWLGHGSALQDKLCMSDSLYVNACSSELDVNSAETLRLPTCIGSQAEHCSLELDVQQRYKFLYCHGSLVA